MPSLTTPAMENGKPVKKSQLEWARPGPNCFPDPLCLRHPNSTSGQSGNPGGLARSRPTSSPDFGTIRRLKSFWSRLAAAVRPCGATAELCFGRRAKLFALDRIGTTRRVRRPGGRGRPMCVRSRHAPGGPRSRDGEGRSARLARYGATTPWRRSAHPTWRPRIRFHDLRHRGLHPLESAPSVTAHVE